MLTCIVLLLSLTSPDPNAPKRGLSAYMFFANEQREKVREDNPGIKFGEFDPFNPLSFMFLTFSQARLASFSVRSGRRSMKSSASHTRPRLLRTRSATSKRRLLTRYALILCKKRNSWNPANNKT